VIVSLLVLTRKDHKAGPVLVLPTAPAGLTSTPPISRPGVAAATICDILAAMNRLAALILVAFLPVIAAAKGGHSSASHFPATHSHSTATTAAHTFANLVRIHREGLRLRGCASQYRLLIH